ncbi:MAG: DNA replication/repair protein RecF [Gammaproteobacteria bacterium]
MALISLELASFRSFKTLSFFSIAGTDSGFGAGINVLWGRNGIGKTSVLESIHLLSLGRSFRCRLMDEAISWTQKFMHLSAASGSGSQISVVKQRGQQPEFRLNGRKIYAASDLARSLPVELLHADTLALIDGTPALRRSFMDRALFILFPDFLKHKKRYDLAMRNRNQLLRNGIADDRLAPWEHQMHQAGTAWHQARMDWIERYSQSLYDLLDSAGHAWVASIKSQLELILEPGWNSSLDLEVALKKSRQRDLKLGYSSLGPHRADWNGWVERKPLASFISRGQRKLLGCFLVFSQSKLLAEHMKGLSRSGFEYQPLLLLDDVHSELDHRSVATVCSLLQEHGGQAIMTALNPDEFDGYFGSDLPIHKFPLERLVEVA